MDKNLTRLPIANIAINKSRLKQYRKNSSIPVYYLEKSSEFQIELFNPTGISVLAVIELNNKTISQGGLVLRPGERIFLDRYLDMARKFKFNTYEVADTNEVKKAIKNNGDFKVEFYNEKLYVINYEITQPNNTIYDGYNGYNVYNTYNMPFDTINMSYSGVEHFKTDSIASNTNIETGRIEKGSYSNQKMEIVNKEWEIFPFHTIKYKLLPISQKINTIQDIKVKRYCINCGSKIRKSDNFCGKCGKKV